MKKRSILFIALVFVFAFVVTGCGKNNLSEYAGTYEGEYVKFVGDSMDSKDTDPFTLVLKEDGTGTHSRDDYDFKVTWEIDGEDFKMTETFIGASIEYTGTLKDGKLDIFNGDPKNDLTAEYVYHKK